MYPNYQLGLCLIHALTNNVFSSLCNGFNGGVRQSKIHAHDYYVIVKYDYFENIWSTNVISDSRPLIVWGWSKVELWNFDLPQMHFGHDMSFISKNTTWYGCPDFLKAYMPWNTVSPTPYHGACSYIKSINIGSFLICKHTYRLIGALMVTSAMVGSSGDLVGKSSITQNSRLHRPRRTKKLLVVSRILYSAVVTIPHIHPITPTGPFLSWSMSMVLNTRNFTDSFFSRRSSK